MEVALWWRPSPTGNMRCGGQDDVGRCVRQMQSKGGNFILSQVDPAAMHLPAVPKRVSVGEKWGETQFENSRKCVLNFTQLRCSRRGVEDQEYQYRQDGV